MTKIDENMRRTATFASTTAASASRTKTFTMVIVPLWLGALLLSLTSFGICVPDLSVCEYADTEVETNLS